MTSTIESFLTNDGVRIVYEKHGENKDITVVLLHGWSGSRRYFDQNVEELSKVACVYRLDMRFHGDSDKPSWGHYVCRLAADVDNFLNAIDLKSVVMVGTSMGCSVIWAYCMLYGTTKMKGAVFVDQSPLQNRKPDWNLGSKGCYDEETLQKTIEDCKNISTIAQAISTACLSVEIDAEYRELLEKETTKADGNALGMLMSDHTHIDWRPFLSQINVPCVNCIGAKSGIFPKEGVETVGQLIPNCKNVIFSEENHWLHIENPSKFNAIVLEFLVQISG